MGKKKSRFLDGFSSDSGDSSDGDEAIQLDGLPREEREEAELLRASVKKRKRAGRSKEAALYGVFAETDEDGELEARGGIRSRKPTNHLRGQAFVPASETQQEGPSKATGSYELGSDEETQVDSEEEEDLEATEDVQMTSEILEDDEPPARAGFGAKVSTNLEHNGFTPASFVSSRLGIGSRQRPHSDEAMDVEDLGEQNGVQNEYTGTHMGLGSGRGGIGSSRGGIGSSAAQAVLPAAKPPSPPTFAPSTSASAKLPTEFASATQSSTPVQKRMSDAKASLASASRTGIPQTGIKFGTGAGGGFNPAAYLASMGWTGGGLGVNGEGISNPIEVQLRPERAGIAFGGRKEKTKQARDEARRRGEAVSSDEEDVKSKQRRTRGQKTDAQKAEDAMLRRAWTKERKPRKPKVEHRTYEEIIAEAGGLTTDAAGVGQVLDARSKDIREMSSIASALAHHPVPTSDSTRLPELRHNLRLINQNSKQTLESLAKDGAAIFERKRWTTRDLDESRRRKEREVIGLTRMTEVLGVAKELEDLARKSIMNADVRLENFDQLASNVGAYTEADIEKFGLDEALVGSLTPAFKRQLAEWSPLEEADAFVHSFSKWSKALRLRPPKLPEQSVQRYEYPEYQRPKQRSADTGRMRPFEALLWHLWMPKVRSALNNEWKPHHPSAAVALLSAWQPILPQYIWDNIIDQILLPKLTRAVHDWELRPVRVSLHHIVFPWLPILQERLDDVMSDARRRLRSTVKLWRVRPGTPGSEKTTGEDEGSIAMRENLSRLREFYPKTEWESLILTQVVPKLSSHLRSTLQINPRAQKMDPLDLLLSWRPLLRSSMLSRILEAEFFPKWLSTLHSWLIQPGADLGQVAQWYSFWKGWFPDRVGELPSVQAGFKQGLELLNTAIELDDGERTKLPAPEYKPLSRAERHSSSQRPKGTSLPSTKQLSATMEEDVTLRSIIEDLASQANLLVTPVPSQVHPTSGQPLLRLSDNFAGKGGVTFYIDEDVAWVRESAVDGRERYAPVSVEELVSRGSNASK